MPVCPLCRYEYQPVCETCPDCGSALVDALPPAVREPVRQPVEEVAIARYGSGLEAQMWLELLKSEGIPAVLLHLTPGSRWVTTDLAPQELRVRADDAPRAREILGLDG